MSLREPKTIDVSSNAVMRLIVDVYKTSANDVDRKARLRSLLETVRLQRRRDRVKEMIRDRDADQISGAR